MQSEGGSSLSTDLSNPLTPSHNRGEVDARIESGQCGAWRECGGCRPRAIDHRFIRRRLY